MIGLILLSLYIYLIVQFIINNRRIDQCSKNIDEIHKKYNLDCIAIDYDFCYREVKYDRKEFLDYDGKMKPIFEEKVVYHFPKWKLEQDHIVLICHPCVRYTTIESKLKRLASRLFTFDLIPLVDLKLETNEVPGTFVLKHVPKIRSFETRRQGDNYGIS